MSLLGGVSVIKVYFPETNRILDLNIWHNPANNGAIMWEYR
jgi:hypothetical protein